MKKSKNNTQEDRLQNWRDLCEVSPKGYSSIILEPPYVVEQIIKTLNDIHPHPHEGSLEPLMYFVMLMEKEAKALLSKKSGVELEADPPYFDIEAAYNVLKVTREIKKQKISKQSQALAFLVIRLISSCMRMEVNDLVESEIQTRIGRKKGGRRPRRILGVYKLIQFELKKNKQQSPQQIWNKLKKYDHENPLILERDNEFYIDGEKLVHTDPERNTKSIKFETFRKHFYKSK